MNWEIVKEKEMYIEKYKTPNFVPEVLIAYKETNFSFTHYEKTPLRGANFCPANPHFTSSAFACEYSRRSFYIISNISVSH